jgi:hypothetical protein
MDPHKIKSYVLQHEYKLPNDQVQLTKPMKVFKKVLVLKDLFLYNANNIKAYNHTEAGRRLRRSLAKPTGGFCFDWTTCEAGIHFFVDVGSAIHYRG